MGVGEWLQARKETAEDSAGTHLHFHDEVAAVLLDGCLYQLDGALQAVHRAELHPSANSHSA